MVKPTIKKPGSKLNGGSKPPKQKTEERKSAKKSSQDESQGKEEHRTKHKKSKTATTTTTTTADVSNNNNNNSNLLPLLQPRPGWDTIFFFFFLTHILITFLWHSQMILPKKIYPKFLQDLTKTYSKDWQDPLNFAPKTPVWYLSIIYCEVFLQLPFHILAVYVFWTGSHYHPWFRIPSIMYSVHVATTFMPIFAYLTSFETLTPCQQSKGQTAHCALGQTLRLKLIAVYYAPFFLIPLRLMTFSVFRTYHADNYAAVSESPGKDSGKDASAKDVPLKGAAGKDAAGKDAAGKDAAGKDAAGKDAAGKDAAGKDAAGKDASATVKEDASATTSKNDNSKKDV